MITLFENTTKILFKIGTIPYVSRLFRCYVCMRMPQPCHAQLIILPFPQHPHCPTVQSFTWLLSQICRGLPCVGHSGSNSSILPLHRASQALPDTWQNLLTLQGSALRGIFSGTANHLVLKCPGLTYPSIIIAVHLCSSVCNVKHRF